MGFTKRRRENLAKLFSSLAQIIFGAFIAGRFISPEKISVAKFGYAMIVFGVFIFLGYLIDKGVE
ncbi:MAG: hypothetical protein ACK4JE_04550 [Endomicrobiia bacterium]